MLRSNQSCHDSVINTYLGNAKINRTSTFRAHVSQQTTLIIMRWPLHVLKIYLWQSAVKGLLELELAFRTLFSKATNDLNFCELVLCILKPFILLASVKFCANSVEMSFQFKQIHMKNVILIVNVLPNDFARAHFRFFQVLWETISVLLPRIPNFIKQHHILFTDLFKP